MKKQENERNPQRALDHVRPGRVSEIAAERKGRAGQDSRETSRPQLPAKRIHEDRRQPVEEDEMQVHPGEIQVAVLERRQKQRPVEREGRSRLHLSEHRLAAPMEGVPQREHGPVKGASLELIPRQYQVSQVRIFKK